MKIVNIIKKGIDFGTFKSKIGCKKVGSKIVFAISFCDFFLQFLFAISFF